VLPVTRLLAGVSASAADKTVVGPQAQETTAANTVAALPRPDLLHPGVARYVREVGLRPSR
jgi:hypothetical protein